MRGKGVQSLFLKASSLADVIHRRRLKRKTRSGTADPRDAERLGQPGRPRPDGPLIWVHAADPQGMAAMLGLMPRLSAERGEDFTVLATTPSPAPAGALATPVIHQLAPVDTVPSVDRFLSHWKPDLAVFCGDALIRAAIHACAAQGIPMVWSDARGRNGAKSGLSASGFGQADKMSKIFTIAPVDRDVMTNAGVDAAKVTSVGQLQEDPVALECDEGERDRLAQILAARPVWLAVAAGLGDVDTIDAAHRHAVRRSHRMLLILRPENAAESPSIAASLAGRGWDIALRSSGDDPEPDTQILIADRPGEDGLWYRLAPLSFFAGTFDDTRDPRNPLDAAALGSAVLHGPFGGIHRARFDRLARAGASRLVTVPDGLGTALESLLAPDKAATLAEAAWRVVSDGAEASDRVIAELANLMDERDLAQ